MKITYCHAAQTDLIRQFRYYLVTLELPRVALHFRESVKRSVREISSHPNVATPCNLRNKQLRSLRSWPIDGFEAMRFYFLVQAEGMRVVRILHGKRDVRRILEKEKLS